MAEPLLPPRKKLKVDEQNIFFYDFLNKDVNIRHISLMRRHLSEIAEGFSGLKMNFLKVDEANARSSVCFTHASCDVSNIKEEGTKRNITLPIGCFFEDGFDVLEKFLDKECPKMPKDVAKRQALRELLTFISSEGDQEVLTKGIEQEKEWMFAIRLVQHLFVPLVPFKTFVIEKNAGLQLDSCCRKVHQLNIVKGDTSFGCVKGWHGHSDMIMDRAVPVTIVEPQTQMESADTDELGRGSEISESSDEVKTGVNFSTSAVKQMIAETIVFSFLKYQQMAESLKSPLIPTVGISSRQLVVHMYDSVADVFVETNRIKLFTHSGKEINFRAVLVLWLVLNYKIFCTGISEKAKIYKSKFHERLGPDYLKIYRSEMKEPVHMKAEDKEEPLLSWENEDDDPLWTLERNVRPTTDLYAPIVKPENVDNKSRAT